MFHVLEQELAWRKSMGKAEGYETMRANKPIVAVGPEHPLVVEELMADYFRKFLKRFRRTSYSDIDLTP